MVDQPEGLVRDELFKLVFGRSGARHIASSGFGRNVVRPMPTQGMIIDVKFTSGSLDRGAGRQEPLDPHAFGVDYSPGIGQFATSFVLPFYFPTSINQKSNFL